MSNHIVCRRLIWTLFVVFTAIHLWFNYSAVMSVVSETINQARRHILVADLFTRREAGLVVL